MIIECENCGAKYKVSNDQISSKGRFVRCTNCAYEWVAYPVGDENKLAQKKAVQNKSNWLFYGTFLIFVITLLLNLSLGLSLFWEEAWFPKNIRNKIQSMFLSQYNYDLALEGISISFDEGKEMERDVNLGVTVSNLGRYNEMMGNLRVTAFDQNGIDIAYLIYKDVQKLKHHEKLFIDSKLINIPVNARFLSIEIINDLDLYLRPASNLIYGRFDERNK